MSLMAKLGNEKSNGIRDLEKLYAPHDIHELKAFLNSGRLTQTAANGSNQGFDDISEIISLFKNEPSSHRGSRGVEKNADGQNHNEIEGYEQLNSKIRSIRFQAVKPETTLTMIDDKLANLETASKEIEKKRKEIKQIVVDVTKQIDVQLQELKTKLEAKFKELNENANQMFKQKLDVFDEMHNKLLVRIEDMQKLRNLFVDTFQGKGQDVDTYESNITKLQERKSDIHHFIQALDPFDLRVTINSCRIRSSLNTRNLEEVIDKVRLVDQEIAGLIGLEDFSSLLDERKVLVPASEDKISYINGSGFHRSQTSRFSGVQFSKTLPYPSGDTYKKEEANNMPSSKALKGLGSLLGVRSKHDEIVGDMRQDDLREYFSAKNRNNSAGKILSGSVGLLTPSSTTPRQNLSFILQQMKVNQQFKGIEPSTLFESIQRDVKKSLNTTPRSLHNRVSSTTFIKPKPHENLDGKVASTIKMNAITGAVSKNSQIGNSLESLRKQRETFLKSSFRNWN